MDTTIIGIIVYFIIVIINAIIMGVIEGKYKHYQPEEGAIFLILSMMWPFVWIWAMTVKITQILIKRRNK